MFISVFRCKLYSKFYCRGSNVLLYFFYKVQKIPSAQISITTTASVGCGTNEATNIFLSHGWEYGFECEGVFRCSKV